MEVRKLQVNWYLGCNGMALLHEVYLVVPRNFSGRLWDLQFPDKVGLAPVIKEYVLEILTTMYSICQQIVQIFKCRKLMSCQLLRST